jgi:hypothetical protein
VTVTHERGEDSRDVTAMTPASQSEHEKIACVTPREVGKCTVNRSRLQMVDSTPPADLAT